MTKTTTRHPGEFEHTLIHELNRLGMAAIPQFRVPGTDTRLDIYIAAPARAYIEIMLGGPPFQFAIRRLLHRSEDIRQKFGGEIVPILVVEDEQWRSRTLTQDLPDAGFCIVTFERSVPAASAAHNCATQIRDFLDRLPYDFKGIRFRFAQPDVSGPWRVHPAPPTKEILDSIKRILAEEDSQNAATPGGENENGERTSRAGATYSLPRPAPSHAPSRQHSEPMGDLMESALPPSDLTLASDIFADVLVSLESVLSPDQFEVLEHELSAFSEEYRHVMSTILRAHCG